MHRTEVLEKAKILVNGARKNEYGTPQENFTRIAKFWSIILNIEVTAAQVALCMAALKITRLIKTETSEDGWVDMAGYAAIGAEVAIPKKNYQSFSTWGMHEQ